MMDDSGNVIISNFGASIDVKKKISNEDDSFPDLPSRQKEALK